MAIVPNLARPWQNPDLHWHGNADEVHGATPVSGEGGSGGVAAYPLPDPTKRWDELGGAGLDLKRGFWTITNPTGANIWRFADRVFIGAEAASNWAGDYNTGDGGTSWVNLVDYPGYLAVNAHVLVISSPGGPAAGSGPYGFSALLRTSDAQQQIIGFGAAVIKDTVHDCWGGIIEMQRESAGGGGVCVGWEFQAKNRAANDVCTVLGIGPGIYGIQLVGGGGFGGPPTAPSTAAMVVNFGTHTWNDGIIFMKQSLTSGRAMKMASQGTGGAHRLCWFNDAGTEVFGIQSYTSSNAAWYMNNSNAGIQFGIPTGEILAIGASASAVNGFTVFGAAASGAPFIAATGSDANIGVTVAAKGNGNISIANAGGINLLVDSYGAVSGVVNHVRIIGVPAGGGPAIFAEGSDANIDLRFIPQGTGVLGFGTFTATPSAVTGYITIKDSGGTLRKLAVIA